MLVDSVPHKHVAIIGTGFGAIATAVRLQQAGFDDFVLERWCQGADGEKATAKTLRPLIRKGWTVVHDIDTG
jgi:glycine/D-amino acid oxidase-like deaminating enzyme